jgi:hypothetical protein
MNSSLGTGGRSAIVFGIAGALATEGYILTTPEWDAILAIAAGLESAVVLGVGLVLSHLDIEAAASMPRRPRFPKNRAPAPRNSRSAERPGYRDVA